MTDLPTDRPTNTETYTSKTKGIMKEVQKDIGTANIACVASYKYNCLRTFGVTRRARGVDEEGALVGRQVAQSTIELAICLSLAYQKKSLPSSDQ